MVPLAEMFGYVTALRTITSVNKAIEVILQELKDRKPLPSVPAPRTYKDLGVE